MERCQRGRSGFRTKPRVQARDPNLRPAGMLTVAKTISYDLPGRAMSGPDDERVETTGLNSGEVLATLMDLEMERHHSAIAGSQFPQVWKLMPRPKDPKDKDAPELSPGASGNERGRVGQD